MAVKAEECRTTESFVDLDLQFHASILSMTGSRMISGMRNLLVDFFRKVPRHENLNADADRMIWEHRELCNAIRAGDVELVRTMIRMHCTEWFRSLSSDEHPRSCGTGVEIR